ncbi:MAG: GTP-dependent dephospho-CoA kinase family protein [Methanolinea sp.]|jgi:hypothetical protein|nr:GTP-dependent dephospho-CoA kinase family protein [Methanolinea sp.]
MLRLPEDQRYLFQSPFGTLVPEITDLSSELPGRRLYTVGDVVTRNVLAMGLLPEVAVVDGHTMRAPCDRTPPLVFPAVYHAENPPGTITRVLVEALRKAIASPPALIIVEGEEDLAVIPLVLEAPEGGWVLYGQPGEGVVIREIDEEARKKAETLLACFIEESEK